MTHDMTETTLLEVGPALADRVRFAERGDYDALMHLCMCLHEENGWFDMSVDRVRKTLMSHYARDGGIIGVIGPVGKIEGAIVMRMAQMWYSDQWLLEEMFSFVHPEFRRSTNAKSLIEFAKSCAVDIGVPLLIGIISNERTEAKVGLYKRQLGKPVGAYFVANDVVRGQQPALAG